MRSRAELWIAWVLANSMGFALGESASRLVGGQGFLGRTPSIGSIIGSVLISGFAAIMQWLVLRRRTALDGVSWAIAGAAGGGAAYILGAIAALIILIASIHCTGYVHGWPQCNARPNDLVYAVGGAAGGATLGLVQRSFLRRESTSPRLWVLGSALGYGTAVTIFWTAGPVFQDLPWIAEPLNYALMGAVAAAITGLVLAFIPKLPNELKPNAKEARTSMS